MKLKELRTRKYVALMIMILIVGAIVGILKIENMDFDKGKVKVSKAVINNVTSSLSANINEAAVDNLITSKGYDEIDYVIKYSLSTDENIKERDVNYFNLLYSSQIKMVEYFGEHEEEIIKELELD